MKNIEGLRTLIDKRDTGEFEDPIGFDNFVQTVAEFFESESEVEEFIKTETFDYVYALSEAYDEIIEKFPSKRLDYLFKKFVLPSYPNGVPTLPEAYSVEADEWSK